MMAIARDNVFREYNMKLLTSRLGLASALAVLCVMSTPPYAANQVQSPQAIGSVFWVATATCPANAVVADGTVLAIRENTSLFTVIGDAYGGDGQTVFKLPDLKGRTIVGSGTNSAMGKSFAIAETGGAESVALSANQLPAHTHDLGTIGMHIHATTADATSTAPTAYVAQAGAKNFTAAIAEVDKVDMSVSHINKQIQVLSVSHIEGAAKPLSIRSPYLALTPCIVTTGQYPPRN